MKIYLSTTNNYMKKLLLLLSCTLLATVIIAQDNKKIDLSNRANDHLLVQLGMTRWANIPDSINTKGLSKSFNVYFMWDFPFKTNPKLSMAFGPGIATDHIVFKAKHVGIKDLTPTIAFSDRSDTTHFKKTKLATAYLEAPVEFRFQADPTKSSFKFALGVKVGTLINAHTRNAKLEDGDGNELNDYTMKEASKRF